MNDERNKHTYLCSLSDGPNSHRDQQKEGVELYLCVCVCVFEFLVGCSCLHEEIKEGLK